MSTEDYVAAKAAEELMQRRIEELGVPPPCIPTGVQPQTIGGSAAANEREGQPLQQQYGDPPVSAPETNVVDLTGNGNPVSECFPGAHSHSLVNTQGSYPIQLTQGLDQRAAWHVPSVLPQQEVARRVLDWNRDQAQPTETGASGQDHATGLIGMHASQVAPRESVPPHLQRFLEAFAMSANALSATGRQIANYLPGLGGWASNHLSQGPLAPPNAQLLGRPSNTVTSGTPTPYGLIPGFLHPMQAQLAGYRAPFMPPGLTEAGGGGALRPGPLLPQATNQSAMNATAKEALQAVINGLETAGPREDEHEPRRSDMKLEVGLLRHQKLALAWMSRRENGTAQPYGGILSDDQGLGKTVTTIALIACNPRSGEHRVPPLIPTAQDKNESSKDAACILKTNGTGVEEDAGPATEVVIDLAGEESAPGKIARRVLEESTIEVVPQDTTTIPADEKKAVGDQMTNPPGESQKAEATTGRIEGGTLVVCPTTILCQWEAEIRSKTTVKAELKPYVYHGKAKGLLSEGLAKFAVVLTTYQTLVQEMPEFKKPADKQGNGLVDLVDEKPNNKRKRELGGRGGPLFRMLWYRVVLDEAQLIKNSRTLAAHAACALRARRRWCLSGTPIQNSIDDLYSYFKFLRYDPYSKYTTFKQMIKDPISGSDSEVGFRRLQVILQGILLRRTKQTEIDGRPIVNLPERRVRLVKCEFSEVERKFYDKINAEAKAYMKRFASEGTVSQNYVNMLSMLLRMRQACNHPMLVRGHKANAHRGELAAVKKLKPDHREKLAEVLRQSSAACGACGDVCEEPVISICQHVFCRQCVSTLISMAGQEPAEADLAFHCSICGQALGQNDTFGADALHVDSTSEGALDAEDPGMELGSSTKVQTLMEVLRELRTKAMDVAASSLGGGKTRSETYAKLAKASRRNRAPSPVRPVRGPSMEKVIVFSQWTSMLDLLEPVLRKEQFLFRRLDGAMSLSARQLAIQDFTFDPEISIMLVSLKAASLGVNLVSANHVVLMDLWYNPATENQAIDRAHRIGQSKAVNVTRITIKDTVEDKILELQDKKQSIIESALGEGEGMGSRARAGLSAQELRFLFGL